MDLVLPGHGPPFAGHREVIDALLAFYARSARSASSSAAGEAPRTPFEIARALFQQLRPGDTFLVLSEMIANLEVLEERGEVARVEERGRYLYRAS